MSRNSTTYFEATWEKNNNLVTNFTQMLQLTNPFKFETYIMYVKIVQNAWFIQIMQVGLGAVKCDVMGGQISFNLGLLWAYPSSGALKKMKMGWNEPKSDFKIGIDVSRNFLSHYMHQSSKFTAHSSFSHFCPISVLKKINLIQI